MATKGPKRLEIDMPLVHQRIREKVSQRDIAAELKVSLPTIQRALKREAEEAKALTDEVLPGQLSIKDADTPAEVHYGAVHEFDALPEGYAKVIQPMRPYTDAEEWALNKSMELYGFIGAIVYDQYGRTLDGNQRQRVARLRGLGVPFTITQVRDDAHALEIARSLNAIRRQYSEEERQALALDMREHGFSYRAIAEALGVGKSTVYRDVFGVLRLRPESESEPENVPPRDNLSVTTEPSTDHWMDHPIVPSRDNYTMEPPTPAPTPEPVQRVQRKGGGTYPAQRPNGTKTKTSKAFDAQHVEERIKDLYMEWLRRCGDEQDLMRPISFLITLRDLAMGRGQQVNPSNGPVTTPTISDATLQAIAEADAADTARSHEPE